MPEPYNPQCPRQPSSPEAESTGALTARQSAPSPTAVSRVIRRATEVMAADAPGGAQAPALAPQVLRLLRGRYRVVGLLLLLGAVGGGLAGWRLGRQYYQSDALIRIAYVLPPVMHETDQNRPMAMFEAFMQSQTMRIGSRRLTDMALASPAWMATGRGATPEVVDEFAQSLTVEFKPRTEYLRIAFTDTDPAVAAAGVQAVVHAYTALYSTQEDDFNRQRLQVLEDQKRAILDALDRLQAEADALSREFGTANLQQLHEAATLRLKTVEDAMMETQVSGARIAGDRNAKPGLPPPVDPVRQQMATERARLEAALLGPEVVGLGENHPTRIRLRTSLERVNQWLARDEALLTQPEIGPSAAAEDGAADATGDAAGDASQSSHAALVRLRDQARDQMVALGVKRLRLDQLRQQSERRQQELTETTDRLKTLQVESSLGGRLTLISAGEVPISPVRDSRRRLAAVGVLFGGGGLPALFLLVGLVRMRYRYSDEAQVDFAARAPLLGILPTVPEGCGHGESAASVQCVHQIRALLQLASPAARSSVYLVTSSAAGEGKTTLAMSLGLSFSASRARTLVIDADLIGQRLTRELDAHGHAGLFEVLNGASFLPRIRKTTVGLWVLPSGRASALDAGAVSAAAFRRVIEAAREHFDAVVIDSGPVLGGVETSLAAPHVDGVLFVLVRGQQQLMVSRAIGHLHALGAPLAGLVFNRAEPRDFSRSAMASRMSSSPAEEGLPGAAAAAAAPVAPPRITRFGPLVRAMITSLPEAYRTEPACRA